MRAAGAVRWAVRQRLAARGLVPCRRYSSAASLAIDSAPSYPRPVHSGKGKERERVAFTSGAGEVSLEQRSFFASDIDLETGTSADGDGNAEDFRALQPGRVVECRRTGISTLGLILSPIISNGKSRLLILRSSGDIWPIVPKDVQFLMPPSLIPSELAEKCWSPALLAHYSNPNSTSSAAFESPEMLEARRKAVVTLRKITRETERMSGRLSMEGGSMDTVWDHFAPRNPKQWGNVTAAEVAEYLLNHHRTTPVQVKPNTLPAFAAHGLMMLRADLFLADQEDMWESGTFLIRSREERDRLARLEKWIDGSPESQRIMEGFQAKARRLIDARRAGTAPPSVEWTSEELDIIHVVLLRLFETRTTQWSPSEKVYIPILKALGTYPGETVDQALIARFLGDIGMLAPHDSLELSKEEESISRNMVVAGSLSGSGELLRGDEMDSLREDFGSQKVFVIDDPGAVELDDGIALESLPNGDAWVHVHVADPTRFLTPNHPVAVEASFRGSATYLPEGNVPLLPLPEVMGKLSLGATSEGGGQSVLTISALLGPNADVKDSKVRLGWLKKPTVVTYEAVNDALGISTLPSLKPFGTPPGRSSTPVPSAVNASDVSALRTMRDLAVQHRRRRLMTAGFESSLPAVSVSLVEAPTPPLNLFQRNSLSLSPHFYPDAIVDCTISPIPTTMTSAGMVAEFMMLAGRVAAEFLSSRGIPAPFRGVAAPVPMAIRGKAAASLEQVLAARDENGYIDPFDVFSFNLFQPTSTVSTTPIPHWAIGYTDDRGYVRATSPLRRFDDLLVHWQIKAALARDAAWRSIPADDLEKLMKRSNTAQKKIRRGGKTATAFWQAGLIKARQLGPAPGWIASDSMVDVRAPVSGRVASQTNVELGIGLTQVYLPSLGVMAAMKSIGSRLYGVSEEVEVRITDVVQWPMPRVNVVPA